MRNVIHMPVKPENMAEDHFKLMVQKLAHLIGAEAVNFGKGGYLLIGDNRAELKLKGIQAKKELINVRPDYAHHAQVARDREKSGFGM